MHVKSTITLDEDVAAAVTAHMRQRGMTFKQTINDLLRRGLAASAPATQRYRMTTFAADINPGFDVDKAGTRAAAAEDQARGYGANG